MVAMESLPPWERNKWWNKYNYFAKPEGQDPVGKVLSRVCPALGLGLIAGLNDVYIRTQCTTIAHAFLRMGFWVIPMTSIGAVYPSITFMSTRLRGKDDPLNHIVGAIATVPIFRVWWKLPFEACLQVGAALSLIAVIYKGMRAYDDDDLLPHKLRPLSVPQYN